MICARNVYALCLGWRHHHLYLLTTHSVSLLSALTTQSSISLSSAYLPLWAALLQQSPHWLSCVLSYIPQVHPHHCQTHFLEVSKPSASWAHWDEAISLQHGLCSPHHLVLLPSPS